MAKKRPMPILSSQNRTEWFTLAKEHFEGEGTDHVIVVDKEEYTLI